MINKITINDKNATPNLIDNNILEYLKKIIINKIIEDNENIKEEKYFSQNIPLSMMSLSKFCLKDEVKNIILPNILDLEKVSYKDFNISDNSLEEIILLVRTLLTPVFRQIMPSNIASGKIPCTSGGSLSIQGIKKWICSGFTYTYIFEKQGGKNKKKYNLSFIIDLSQSVLLLCNYSHAIVTIAPSTVEDNEEIFLDVIINTNEGIKIVDFNSQCRVFQKISKINEIINVLFSSKNIKKFLFSLNKFKRITFK